MSISAAKVKRAEQSRRGEREREREEAELHSTHVENMIDSFLLTSFDEEKKSINFATEQLTTIFSTVVRKALRKRKLYRCKKEIAKAGWFDKE